MNFVKWVPIIGLSKKLFLEGVYDDYEGFRLLLKDDANNKMLRISFDAPISYRNTDEGSLINTISNQDLGAWTFYMVENSNFLKWLINESHGVQDEGGIIHYAIYTPNDCIDVLSEYPPTVEWLN